MAASPGLEPLVTAHKGHTRVTEPGWGCFPCRGASEVSVILACSSGLPRIPSKDPPLCTSRVMTRDEDLDFDCPLSGSPFSLRVFREAPPLPLIPAAETAIQSSTCPGWLQGWHRDQANLPHEGEYFEKIYIKRTLLKL